MTNNSLNRERRSTRAYAKRKNPSRRPPQNESKRILDMRQMVANLKNMKKKKKKKRNSDLTDCVDVGFLCTLLCSEH